MFNELIRLEVSMNRILLILIISSNFGLNFAKQLYPFPKDGKWGYINSSGRTVIQPIYESASFFIDGLAKISQLNDRNEYLYGFINKNGGTVIPPKFISVSDFKGGIARVKIKNQFSYLLKNGTIINKNKYDNIFPATNGFSIMCSNELYGFTDINGDVIVPLSYMKVYNFNNNLALVTKDKGYRKNYGFINTKGKLQIPMEYQKARSFSEGFAGVSKGSDWYFIDHENQPISDKKFHKVGDFKEGLAKVQIEGKWGYINTVGEIIIPPIYEIADNFSKGLAIVGNGNLFGYINKQGKQVASFSFSRATRFNGKLARVSKGNQNGFMNGDGRANLTDKIYSIGSFHNDRARMRVGRYYGYYSTEAKLVINPIYLYASDFKEDLAITIAPILGGYKASYINKFGQSIKSWDIIAKMIPQNNDILFSIAYPTIPFYKENNPESRVIIKANFGGIFIKNTQKTAIPVIGHGLNGLLYSAEYFARPGYVFSEAISRFPIPKINMGIYPYFRERFGVVSETSSPSSYLRSMNSSFFNGSTMYRTINRNKVNDTYFIPFMKVSESLFLFAAAIGFPIAEYPERNTSLANFFSKPIIARFNGRYDRNDNPTQYSINFGKERIEVLGKKLGIKLIHTYNKPTISDKLSIHDDPVFISDKKYEDIIKPLLTNTMLLDNTNRTQTEIIIGKVETTNTIDLTSAIIEDALQKTNILE